jgi:hypothetical protein
VEITAEISAAIIAASGAACNAAVGAAHTAARNAPLRVDVPLHTPAALVYLHGPHSHTNKLHAPHREIQNAQPQCTNQATLQRKSL